MDSSSHQFFASTGKSLILKDFCFKLPMGDKLKQSGIHRATGSVLDKAAPVRPGRAMAHSNSR